VATAGIIVIRQDRVLLIEHQEGAGHITGAWGIPAGGIDEGETAPDAAVRELHEETGLRVDAANLIELPKLYRARIARKSGADTDFTLRVFATACAGAPSAWDEGIPRWVALTDVRLLSRRLRERPGA
jgi:8-oxo-dGTP pyrophosphatase MutT (NUDIX family)